MATLVLPALVTTSEPMNIWVARRVRAAVPVRRRVAHPLVQARRLALVRLRAPAVLVHHRAVPPPALVRRVVLPVLRQVEVAAVYLVFGSSKRSSRCMPVVEWPELVSAKRMLIALSISALNRRERR